MFLFVRVPLRNKRMCHLCLPLELIETPKRMRNKVVSLYRGDNSVPMNQSLSRSCRVQGRGVVCVVEGVV